jgi:undecaprenyl diphosphate synthase
VTRLGGVTRLGAPDASPRAPTERPSREATAAETEAGPGEGTAIPRHVAIVMDGNRRWARLRGVPEAEGHAAGVQAIRPIVEHAVRRGIEALSLYAFSRENWSRSQDEVRTLFALLEAAIRDETPELVRQGVNVRILGRLDELPEQTRASI